LSRFSQNGNDGKEWTVVSDGNKFFLIQKVLGGKKKQEKQKEGTGGKKDRLVQRDRPNCGHGCHSQGFAIRARPMKTAWK